ncbi:MAG: hypothetical protein VX003_00115, partial [SAR324 cluster bacterium]|nr:hypothetical protein [SAR324 cluster bacterium]
FDGKSCWGPMLIFIMGNDDLDMLSCSEEDLQAIENRVRFLEETEFQGPMNSQPLSIQHS